MPTPWKYLLNLADPGWVHCVSRCVRRVYLAGDAWEHRRVCNLYVTYMRRNLYA
jgi:hypothetical protein